jgi:hypothetical protein
MAISQNWPQKKKKKKNPSLRKELEKAFVLGNEISRSVSNKYMHSHAMSLSTRYVVCAGKWPG